MPPDKEEQETKLIEEARGRVNGHGTAAGELEPVLQGSSLINDWTRATQECKSATQKKRELDRKLRDELVNILYGALSHSNAAAAAKPPVDTKYRFSVALVRLECATMHAYACETAETMHAYACWNR